MEKTMGETKMETKDGNQCKRRPDELRTVEPTARCRGTDSSVHCIKMEAHTEWILSEGLDFT
ncbi:hypothetical protein MPTK1_7g00780 [Marchantia polymorpha subsp. ruderalis]